MDIGAMRAYVRAECAREQNVFGPSFYEEHLAVVAEYGTRLAERLGADREIVETAAWLHDIAAVRDRAALPRHAALGAAMAGELLCPHGYTAAEAGRIAACIASHSTPLAIGEGTTEEVCVSNADAIAQIVRPVYWLYMVYGVRRLGYEEGRRWLLERVEGNWRGLVGNGFWVLSWIGERDSKGRQPRENPGARLQTPEVVPSIVVRHSNLRPSLIPEPPQSHADTLHPLTVGAPHPSCELPQWRQLRTQPDLCRCRGYHECPRSRVVPSQLKML